jgi:hypothetical protein
MLGCCVTSGKVGWPGEKLLSVNENKRGLSPITHTGSMEIETTGPGRFSAWTARRYDDPSRFPTRIKAAATALFVEDFSVKRGNAR